MLQLSISNGAQDAAVCQLFLDIANELLYNICIALVTNNDNNKSFKQLQMLIATAQKYGSKEIESLIIFAYNRIRAFGYSR